MDPRRHTTYKAAPYVVVGLLIYVFIGWIFKSCN